jgi:hypothetical protein
MRRVTLYTRSGCGLCEEAASELRRIQKRFPFELACVDIDADAALRARFDSIVPVIALDGSVIAQAPLALLELEDVLVSAARPT